MSTEHVNTEPDHDFVVDVDAFEIVPFASEDEGSSSLPALVSTARLVAEAFQATEPMEPAEVERRVEGLMYEMLKVFPSVDFPLEHHHTGDLYARELKIPKGAFAIGAIQKYPHISVISQGEISMLNERGGITRIKAPCTIVSKPGVRKVGFAHEETVWTTIHSMANCHIENPSAASNDELEAFIACKEKRDYQAFLESRLVERIQ